MVTVSGRGNFFLTWDNVSSQPISANATAYQVGTSFKEWEVGELRRVFTPQYELLVVFLYDRFRQPLRSYSQSNASWNPFRLISYSGLDSNKVLSLVWQILTLFFIIVSSLFLSLSLSPFSLPPLPSFSLSSVKWEKSSFHRQDANRVKRRCGNWIWPME